MTVVTLQRTIAIGDAGPCVAIHQRTCRVVALEWRVAGTVGLLVEVEGASRLITNLAHYPGFQSYLRIGARVDVSAGVQLEAGFSENLAHQQATTDFGVFAGVVRSF